jgi:hypothetical protein
MPLAASPQPFGSARALAFNAPFTSVHDSLNRLTIASMLCPRLRRPCLLYLSSTFFLAGVVDDDDFRAYASFRHPSVRVSDAHAPLLPRRSRCAPLPPLLRPNCYPQRAADRDPEGKTQRGRPRGEDQEGKTQRGRPRGEDPEGKTQRSALVDGPVVG